MSNAQGLRTAELGLPSALLQEATHKTKRVLLTPSKAQSQLHPVLQALGFRENSDLLSVLKKIHLLTGATN